MSIGCPKQHPAQTGLILVCPTRHLVIISMHTFIYSRSTFITMPLLPSSRTGPLLRLLRAAPELYMTAARRHHFERRRSRTGASLERHMCST